MAKITATQVLETRKVIEELRKARDEERDNRDKEIYHLKWDIYQKKIKEVEEERDNAVRTVEATRDKAIAEKDKEIEARYPVILQAQRILAILSTSETEPLTIGDDEVKVSRYGTESPGESLGYFLDDDYLKIKLFIITNGKPKNKYSLIAVGCSIFSEPLIKYQYSYGVDINNWQRFKLQVVLQFAPTPDELKAWLTKHKGILKDTLEQYQQVKQEYISTKQEYKADDFKELITWTCPQCNNFRTIFDCEPAGGVAPQCYRHDPYVNMVAEECQLPEKPCQDGSIAV